MRIWDSFFALIILWNIVWAPLAIAFQHDLYKPSDDVDWKVLDLIVNGFWLIAFFINCNRVDFVKQIVTLEDTLKAYLKSPFLIVDFVSLVGSVSFILVDENINAKYFELLRIFHFTKTLFPVNLCISNTTNSGQKRVT